jgi:phage FluMu protein Com
MLQRRKFYPGTAPSFKRLTPCCAAPLTFHTLTRTSTMDIEVKCPQCRKALRFDILYVPEDNYFAQIREQE